MAKRVKLFEYSRNKPTPSEKLSFPENFVFSRTAVQPERYVILYIMCF